MAGTAELQDLQTLGVSLVKRGANRKWIAMTKGDEPSKLAKALEQLIKAGPVDDAQIEKVCTENGLDPKETEGVKAMMRIRAAFPDAANMDKALAAIVGQPAAAPPTEGNPAEKPKDTGVVPNDQGAQVTKEEIEKAEHEKLEQIKKAEDTAKEVGELKALLKSQGDAIAKAEAKAKEADVALKSEQNKRREGEWLVKAEKDLKGVPGKTAEALAKELLELEDKMGAEYVGKHFETLKASSAALLKSALFVENGTPGAGGGGSAWQKIEKAAESVKDIDTSDLKYMHPSVREGVIKARSVAKVLEQNKGLYKEFLIEKGAA